MFKLEIDTTNAAFEGPDERWEVARMLRALAAKIAETDVHYGTLRDSNGNTVGSWQFVED